MVTKLIENEKGVYLDLSVLLEEGRKGLYVTRAIDSN